MTPAVVAIVALSAVLHAGWNVLLKTTGDPLRTSGRLLGSSAAVYLPLAVVAWLAVGRPAVPVEAFAVGTVSALLQAAYFILLSAAYRRGDLSVVYPIARGSAPLFAVLAGVLLLGEQLGAFGWAGVVALLGAVLVVQRPWDTVRSRRATRASALPQDTAILFALATGLAIAAYSTVDRIGARLVAPWIFAAIFFPLSAVFLVLWIRFVDTPRRSRTASTPAAPAPWNRATATGLISLAAYLLILFAYTMAPLTVVVPLRESAVVLVSGWGTLRLAEARGRAETASRLLAGALVMIGVGLLVMD